MRLYSKSPCLMRSSKYRSLVVEGLQVDVFDLAGVAELRSLLGTRARKEACFVRRQLGGWLELRTL